MVCPGTKLTQSSAITICPILIKAVQGWRDTVDRNTMLKTVKLNPQNENPIKAWEKTSQSPVFISKSPTFCSPKTVFTKLLLPHIWAENCLFYSIVADQCATNADCRLQLTWMVLQQAWITLWLACLRLALNNGNGNMKYTFKKTFTSLLVCSLYLSHTSVHSVYTSRRRYAKGFY